MSGGSWSQSANRNNANRYKGGNSDRAFISNAVQLSVVPLGKVESVGIRVEV